MAHYIKPLDPAGDSFALEIKVKMKHQLTVICLLGLLQCWQEGNAQQRLSGGQSVTLPEVWARLEKHNKELKSKELEVKKSEAQWKSARIDRLPELNVGGSYSRVSDMMLYKDGIFREGKNVPVIPQSYSIGGEAALNLYNGGKTKLEIQLKKVQLEMAADQHDLAGADLKFKSAVYYFELLRNYQFKALMLQEIAYEEKQLKEISHLYQNGIVLKSDVLRADLKVSNQKLLISEIENNIVLGSQQLNIMMGQADSIRLAPDPGKMENPPSSVLSYQEYLALALKRSFEIKLSANERTLKDLNVKQVKSNVLPKLSLFSAYHYNYPQSSFYPYSDALWGFGQLGLKVTMPISNFYLNKHKTTAAVISSKQQKLAYEIREDEIRTAVNKAWLHYTEALKRIDVAKKNILQATESLRILRNSYFNQQALLTDMLDTETQLLQSRFDLTTAEVNAQIQYYQLLKTVGKI